MSEKDRDVQKATGMCAHGNFPNSCPICHSESKEAVQATDPKDLLLSAEQEAAIEQKEGEVKRIHAKDDEQEIVVLGVEHTSELDRARPIEQELETFDPNIVFVEGEDLEARFPGKSLEEILNMPAEQVLQQQEQAYAFWLAAKQGKEVRSWDLPAGGEIRGALELTDDKGDRKHTMEDALTWHVLYAMKKLYESHTIPSAQSIYEAIEQGVPSAIEILGLTLEKIEQTVTHAAGKSLEEFSQRVRDNQLRSEDQQFVTVFSDPRTNAFARDMNVVRDRHAIGLIQQAKKDGYKKILITAGRSHAYTWEPAIQAIYSPEKNDRER